MPNADVRLIQNPQRLHALDQRVLLDTPAEEAFDRLTRLASYILDVPVSLVSLVGADRQFFKSAVGLPEPWASKRETPLSHSFCQHVVASNTPLVIEDARKHPLVQDNLAIPDLNVIGYLGIPLTTSQGEGLGSFCAVDGAPRQWSERDIYIMQELAQSVMTEIELRSEMLAREEAQKAVQEANLKLSQANRQLSRITEFAHSTLEHTMSAIERGAESSEIVSYLLTAERALTKRDVKDHA
jgi:GAF domain-containing protein